jgi:hypothetical protein
VGAARQALELGDGSDHHCIRAACMCSMSHFLRILGKASWRLSSEEIDAAKQCGFRFLSCYQYLAAAADARNEKLWAIKPKFHYFWHVPPLELEFSVDHAWLTEQHGACKLVHAGCVCTWAFVRSVHVVAACSGFRVLRAPRF